MILPTSLPHFLLPLILVLLLPVLLSSAAPIPVVSCSGAGYDLSALTTTDFFYTDSDNRYSYAYRPCGAAALCPQKAGTKNSACQLFVGQSLQYSISRFYSNSNCSPPTTGCFNATALTTPNLRTANGPGQIPLGVQLVQSATGDADSCFTQRQLITNFLCAPVSIPILASVLDLGCKYEFTIYTDQACHPATTNTQGS